MFVLGGGCAEISTGAQGQVYLQTVWCCCWESWCIALFSWCCLLWLGSLVHWLKNPESIKFPPPCLTVGMVFLGLKSSPFYTKCRIHHCDQTISSDHKTEDQNYSSSSRWAFAKAKWAFGIWKKWSPPWSASVEPSSVQCPLNCLSWDVATSRAHIHQDGLSGDPSFSPLSLSSLPAQVSLLASDHVFWDFPQCGMSCVF